MNLEGEMAAFVRGFQAGWGEMDFNAHMRNTAYLDFAATVRMLYFAANGFPVAEFERLRIGPVVQRDEVGYGREIRLLESFTVDLTLAALSPDGARFRLRNRFVRDDGKEAAVVTSSGGWLDLAARRLTAPPPRLRQVLDSLDRTDDFSELPAIGR